jgi:phospho-N-acetylmuramoyl-pentapeptide-transferase
MIRLLLAAALSFSMTALGTRILIDVLTRQKIGQPIREDGPQGHLIKAGTPTMGGLAIVGGAASGYVLSDVIAGGTFTRAGLIVMATICAAAAVGFMDDWLKVSRERNLGLNKKAKIAGLLLVAGGFAIALPALTTVHYEVSFTRVGSPGISIGLVGWMLWAILIIIGTTNGTNLADGLDGLAAGSGIFSFLAYAVIGFWIFRQSEDPIHDIYDVPHALDLAVVALAMVGALAGFLWFNAAPAEIFMGDTGSLAIGAGLAGLALATNTHLLLPIIGGLYVAETVSVMLQVGYYKLTKGKRLFRMAPIHHHFEILGWKETKVIIRFWLICGALTALGLGLFYADWVRTVDLIG